MFEWTPEQEKAFREEMKICKGMRADGRDGKCCFPYIHNLGCVGCGVEAGLFEPEALENEN
jgi:hypothetical protein